MKRIGEFLVEKKVLSPLQVEQILEYGKRENVRFGEAGVKLGLLDEEALVRVFGKNYRVDFFHLDSRYFPKQTSGYLKLETILRFGVIPLGSGNERGFFKRGKILNLGLLDPGRMDAIETAVSEARAHEEITNHREFLVLADQFLDILQTVYGVNASDLAKRDPGQLDPTLAMFLEERV